MLLFFFSYFYILLPCRALLCSCFMSLLNWNLIPQHFLFSNKFHCKFSWIFSVLSEVALCPQDVHSYFLPKTKKKIISFCRAFSVFERRKLLYICFAQFVVDPLIFLWNFQFFFIFHSLFYISLQKFCLSIIFALNRI